MTLRKVPEGDLREGFTTGSSATASAKAALLAIVHQKVMDEVAIHLPVGKVLTIPVHSCTYEKTSAVCSVIKDAGDDPDVTNGAEIGCKVQLIDKQEVVFSRGEGIGVVTLPGLELNVGEPAINPVPRKMMRDSMHKILRDYDMECGVHIEVFVVNGEALAKRTLNERVGIQEGLSILGTTGIVVPYSSSSYIASIEQGIDVAVANGINELVINSGARSEKYLRKKFDHLTEQSFIHYGNWIGDTLKKVKTSPVQKLSIGIMLGKAVKLAAGYTDTHSCISEWNKKFVQQLAMDSGYESSKVEVIAELNMAGRLTELFEFTQEEKIYQKILACCYKEVVEILPDVETNIYLISKSGSFIHYIKS